MADELREHDDGFMANGRENREELCRDLVCSNVWTGNDRRRVR